MIPLDILPEYYMQRIVRRACSNADRVWTDVRGKEVRVLAIGDWNVHEGPDFLHVSISHNGVVSTGHAEVHKRSSDWFAHGHHRDVRYNDVVLHIVLEDNRHVANIPHTVLFREEDRIDTYEPVSLKDQVLSLENLQDFAFSRLLRKANATSELCELRGIASTLEWAFQDFLARVSTQRRRPGSQSVIVNAQAVVDSLHEQLRALLIADSCEIVAMLNTTQTALQQHCGIAAATELMTNVVVPTLFTLLPDRSREGLLIWYWQLRAPTSYGMLRRRFPYIPQDFVWQQQSMLEYYQTLRLRKERVQDLMIEYFAGSNYHQKISCP